MTIPELNVSRRGLVLENRLGTGRPGTILELEVPRGEQGDPMRVRAEVVVDDEFSVHADADELLSWLQQLPAPPDSVYIVHGEPDASAALATRVRELFDCAVAVPRLGERVLVDQ